MNTQDKAPERRFLKVGDIVRLNNCWKCSVIAVERNGMVKCKTSSGGILEPYPACFIELVTPVEELEAEAHLSKIEA